MRRATCRPATRDTLPILRAEIDKLLHEAQRRSARIAALEQENGELRAFLSDLAQLADVIANTARHALRTNRQCITCALEDEVPF